MTKEFRTGIRQSVCGYEAFKQLLVGGATIEDVYIKPDGSEIGRQAITQQMCGLKD
ncbi:hypothetical protein BH23PSE1_BH23PSE1_03060 [soil metagenome]